MKTTENRRILLNFDLLKPTEDKIIIEPWFEPNVTESGLLLPEAKKTSYGLGKVISFGPTVNCELKVGDFVILRPGIGVMIEASGDQQFLIMRQSEVLGIIDAKDPLHDITPNKAFDPRTMNANGTDLDVN